MAALLVEVIAQAHRDPECAALAAAGDQRIIDGFAELVERLRAAGRADPGYPPEVAARWVLTASSAAATRSRTATGRRTWRRPSR